MKRTFAAFALLCLACVSARADRITVTSWSVAGIAGDADQPGAVLMISGLDDQGRAFSLSVSGDWFIAPPRDTPTNASTFATSLRQGISFNGLGVAFTGNVSNPQNLTGQYYLTGGVSFTHSPQIPVGATNYAGTAQGSLTLTLNTTTRNGPLTPVLSLTGSLTGGAATITAPVASALPRITASGNGGTLSSAAVPEPATLLLVGGGLLALRRRRE